MKLPGNEAHKINGLAGKEGKRRRAAPLSA